MNFIVFQKCSNKDIALVVCHVLSTQLVTRFNKDQAYDTSERCCGNLRAERTRREMADINVKVLVVALFYQRGKTGSDVLYKETYRVPIPIAQTKTLKSFMEYLR